MDKLTSKKYAKTVNLLCAGNQIFVTHQTQGVFNTNPLAYALEHDTTFARAQKQQVVNIEAFTTFDNVSAKEN